MEPSDVHPDGAATTTTTTTVVTVPDYPTKAAAGDDASDSTAVVQGAVVDTPDAPPYFQYCDDGSLRMHLPISRLIYFNCVALVVLLAEGVWLFYTLPGRIGFVFLLYIAFICGLICFQMRFNAICSGFLVEVSSRENTATVTSFNVFTKLRLAKEQLRTVALSSITRVAVETPCAKGNQAAIVVYSGESRAVVGRTPELCSCGMGDVPAIAAFWVHVARENGAPCPDVAFDGVMMPTRV